MRAFIFVTFVVFCIYVSQTLAQTPSACCTPSGLPNCGNTTIENYVCAVNELDECCTTKWSAECAELVHFAFVCPPVCGDGFCEASETCSSCAYDCGACDLSGCSTAFNTTSDPLAAAQWHLTNTGKQGGKAGNDVNVAPVWKSGIYGKGVKIAIVDTGLQRNHPDIQCNYDASISYDFDQGKNEPTPLAFEEHATSCAGVAAARDNNVCGVGAAFRASIGGIRILGRNFADSIAASALAFKNNEIDIYSNSWGPTDDGASLERFPRTLNVIANAVKNGRNGKGNIFVWAAGNGRLSMDHANADELANSPYTITVSASDYNGVASIYSEAGANVLVNAPSNTYVAQSNGQYKAVSGIVTSDLLGFRGDSSYECTTGFGGTSAATPLVAGVVALMLEANANLTWRDVQHVLVNTADQNDVNNTEWSQNAAGYSFNPFYGFGRVNAEKAVAASKTWVSVCPTQIELKQHVDVNNAIPQSVAEELVIPVTFYQEVVVEHVVVKINANHAARGQLVLALSSPTETVTILSVGRSRDNTPDYIDFPFSSVQMWGEMSNGTWSLSLYDSVRDGRIGTINYFEISIFGSRKNCTDVSDTTETGYRPRPTEPVTEVKAFDIYAIGAIILGAVVGLVAIVIGCFVFFKLFVGELSQYSSFKSLFE